MTREEYERLLQSDYWKGYSYSLIKVRNFTCEDCGRSFPNERNKLQVHHLVYRDANPWSYSPNELVVLCEECHKKRHGIMPETTPVEESASPKADVYTRSYSSDYNTSERGVKPNNRRYPTFRPRIKKERRALLVIFCILAVLLFFGNPTSKKTENKSVSSEPEITEVKNDQMKTRKVSSVVSNRPADFSENAAAPKASSQEVVSSNELIEVIACENEEDANIEKTSSADQALVVESLDLPPTIDISEDAPQEVSKPTEQADASAEPSLLELLEQKNHENAVKQAQRAGVSTEGTTLEILERINHANAVKQAQRAGVSTEGTTLEILERINHANAVKQAQRAGVSAEGTTLEILERINKKNLQNGDY